MEGKKPKLYIGTSGYSYKHWRDGVFYPPHLGQKKWLTYYGERFDTVEINNTFYGLPSKEVFRSWYDRTPPGFTFSIKGSRYITHLKKLKGAEDSVALFMDHATGLEEKLNIILWQLPENMTADSEVLQAFCSILEKEGKGTGVRHAFELRNASWFNEETYKLLVDCGYALCMAHSNVWPCVDIATADYVYLRFHGGQALYSSEYSDDELHYWASAAKRHLEAGKDVYAYFNNDANGFAVRNALRLKEIILDQVFSL